MKRAVSVLVGGMVFGVVLGVVAGLNVFGDTVRDGSNTDLACDEDGVSARDPAVW